MGLIPSWDTCENVKFGLLQVWFFSSFTRAMSKFNAQVNNILQECEMFCAVSDKQQTSPPVGYQQLCCRCSRQSIFFLGYNGQGHSLFAQNILESNMPLFWDQLIQVFVSRTIWKIFIRVTCSYISAWRILPLCKYIISNTSLKWQQKEYMYLS